MVATLGRMASDSYYLEAQKTWRPDESGGAPALLFPGGSESGGADGGGGGATAYYDSGEEPDGIWWNPDGMLGLDDGTNVESREFRQLYHGYDPRSGEALTRNAGSSGRCPGLDLTFSADKSVSALWAIADADLREAIAKAHNEACRTALDTIVREHCSYTRIRPDGGDVELIRANICGAMFQHGTSRDGDPQLHTHCLVFNVTQADDGVFRSHYRSVMFRWQKAAGATYRNALAWNLQEQLGIQMERYGAQDEFTRVVGMPESLLQEWSKRRRMIQAMAEEMGIATGASASAAEALNKASRKVKVAEQGGDLRHVAWDLEASSHIDNREEFVAGLTGHEVAASEEEISEVMDRLDRLPHDITAHEAVFRLPDIVEKTMNASAGVMGPMDSSANVQRVIEDDEVVELDTPTPTLEVATGMAHTRIFSTRTEIGMERELGEMAGAAAHDSRLAIPAVDIELKLARLRIDGYPLSEEQVEAIRYGAGPGSGRLAIIEGAAGAGKTTTLRPITDLYQEHGCKVLATAVAWRTAVALGNDCGVIPYSVDRLLRRVARGDVELDDKTVIVIDEAGMLSTRQAWHFLRLAQEHDCKVIAAGDTAQHQPIGAGPGLRLMRKAAGGVRVDEIRRQRPDVEDILVHVRGALPETARLHAQLMDEGQRRKIVDDYEVMAEKPAFTPWQIGVSEAFRDGRAGEAIAALAERDRFHLGRNLDATLGRLVTDWETWRADNPERVAAVIARTHDEVKVLSHLMRERTLAGRDDSGERAVIRACGARSDDDRERPLEIARGDLLRIGSLHWEKRLFNGTIVEVADVKVHGKGTEGERVEIIGRSEYGEDVAFFCDEITDIFGRVRLDHGYAMTIASAQGRTVDAAFVLADDRAARPTIYPAATRHKEHFQLYVNRMPVAAAAAAGLPEDEQGRAVTDDEVLEFLAERWSRNGNKVAAHDFMSRALAARVGKTYPGGKGAQMWLGANDNESGTLRALGRTIRDTADRWRHGEKVAAMGAEMRALDEEYDVLAGRLAAAGGGVGVVIDEFRAHAVQQRDLVAKAAPLTRSPSRYRSLWRDSAGMAVEDVEAFRARHGALDEWVRTAGKVVKTSGEEERRDEMAIGGWSLTNSVEREILAEFCGAQQKDRFRWMVEGQERLDALHTRAVAAVASWPSETAGGDGRANVEQYIRDYSSALAAWRIARTVVADVDAFVVDPSSNKREAVMLTIAALEADAGHIWHDETLRIISGVLTERGVLLSAAAWLEGAKATLEGPVEAKTAEVERAGGRSGAQAPPRAAPRTRSQRPRRERGDWDEPLPSASEVAARLAERAEDVCRQYLPGGRREGNIWRVGDAEGRPGRSTWVYLTGERRGRWTDGNTDENGDLLHIIQRSRRLPGIAEALKEASAYLGAHNVTGTRRPVRVEGRAPRPAPAKGPTAEELVRRRIARETWEGGLAIRSWDSTPASRYLSNRGLDPANAGSLRWRAETVTREAGQRVSHPALIAAIETHDGKFEGVQRIFLTTDGGKAAIAGAKRHLGPLQKGGVWFGNRNATRIAMTEGVEDALAAIEVLPPGTLDDLAIVASVGVGRMHRIELPASARELVLLQDTGAAGERGWKALQKKYRDGEVRVTRIVPRRGDINDDLVADRDALEHLLSPLAAAGPVEGVATTKRLEAELEAVDLEGRVDMWRARAANGGWAAADIHELGDDLERTRKALTRYPRDSTGEDRYRLLRDFADDAGRAREALRIAGGLVGGLEDLWRERKVFLSDVLAAPDRGAAARRFFSDPPQAWVDWTGRAGRALEAIEAVRASEGTCWEHAALSLLAERAAQSGAEVRRVEWAASAESRGILFLGDSTRELSEALKGDDRMRTTVTGEAVQQSRMSQGGHRIS